MSHDQIKQWEDDFTIRHLGPMLQAWEVPSHLWQKIILTFKKYGDYYASSWEEYRSIALVRLYKTAKKLAVIKAPEPKLPAKPEPGPWRPCAHYDQGSTRQCERCKHPVPALRRAQEMYDGCRKFVLQRLDRSLPKYIGGNSARSYSKFHDVEQEVWSVVAQKIDGFTPNPNLSKDGALAWLAEIVRLVVLTHFKRENAKTRGARVTTSLEAQTSQRLAPHPDCYLPAAATPAVRPDEDSGAYERWETV